MISTGKHRAAMALALVLMVSACGGGAQNPSGDGPVRGLVRGIGNIFGTHTAEETAPASENAPAATAQQVAAPPPAPAQGGANTSQLAGMQDATLVETEAVAGSGSFRGVLNSIFTRNKSDPPPTSAVAADAASAPRTIAGQAPATQTVAAQPERRGLFNGYFRDLFKSDSAAANAQAGLSAGVVGGTFGRNVSPEVTLRVNRYIWTAALDVLSFLPLETVDPFSGVFTTGFGIPPGGGRAYRATVYVQDPALDARSLHVALEARGGGPVSLETTRAVENAILTRARQFRLAEINR